MPRLVVPKHPGAGRFATEKMDDIPPDKYKDRLVKYIPAESIALYAFTDKLLIAYYGITEAGTATKIPADAVLSVVSWALFILGLAGTPIYLYKQRIAAQPWKLNAVISTIAVGLWVYTLGGSV